MALYKVGDSCTTEAEEQYKDDESIVDPTASKVLSARLATLQRSHQQFARTSQQLRQKCESLPAGHLIELAFHQQRS